MPYPFMVVVSHIPLVNGESSLRLATKIWTAVSKDVYGKVRLLDEIDPIDSFKEKLDQGVKVFYWSQESSVTDDLSEGCYKITVLEEEIVIELV